MTRGVTADEASAEAAVIDLAKRWYKARCEDDGGIGWSADLRRREAGRLEQELSDAVARYNAINARKATTNPHCDVVSCPDGPGSLGAFTGTRDQVAEAIADELHSTRSVIQLSGNAPLEIFPFVTCLHREVVLRHKDGESEDIEMTPDEADQVADRLKAAAAVARAVKVET